MGKRPTAGSTATCRPPERPHVPCRRTAADHATRSPTLARPNAVLTRPTRRLWPEGSGADPPHGGRHLSRIDSPHLMDLA
jgi:hypothetical protein